MASKAEVESFLREFQQKKEVWDILFRDDRGKNAQTLADLEIRPIDREKIIDDLNVTDYCQGPIEETIDNGPPMWVFGKEIKKNEIYIKITLGFPSTSVICISFHTAEHSLIYPYKS